MEKEIPRFIHINQGHGIQIPQAELFLSGLADRPTLEMHTTTNAAVLVKRQMTATELVRVADSLYRLADQLLLKLVDVCICGDERDEFCAPPETETALTLGLPQELMAEAEIGMREPLNTQVMAEDGMIIISRAEPSALDKIPQYMMEILEGLKFSWLVLEELLAGDDLVYGV